MSHRRILLLFLVFLAILSSATYFVLFRTGAAKDFIEELIGKSIHKNLFDLDQAEIDLAEGRVTIREFQLADPSDRGSTAKLLSVDKVEVDLETNPLDEIGAVRRVVLDGLEINLSLADNEVPDFGKIFADAGIEPAGKGEFDLPAISITNSRMSLRVAPDRPAVAFDKLNLEFQRLGDESRSVQLRGSMRSPLGHTVEISGGGDLRSMDFRTVLTLQNVPLHSEQAGAFEVEAERFLERAKVKGNIDKAQVWMEYRGSGTTAAERGFRGGVVVEFADVSLTPPEFPYAITAAKGKLFAESIDGGKVRFQIAKKGVDGDFSVTGELLGCLEGDPQVDLDITAKDILIGPRLLNAVEQGNLSVLKEVRTAFAPTAGRVGAKIQIRTNSAGELEALADIELAGVSSRFHGFVETNGQQIGFPYPIENARGKLNVRHDRIVIEEVKAQDANGAPVTIRGQVTNLLATPAVNLDIDAGAFTFSREIRDALKSVIAEGPAIYDEFTPKGKSDVSVRLRDDGTGLRTTVIIEPLRASAMYAPFPYRLNELTGRVTISDAGAFIDLEGSRDESTASIQGRFLFAEERSLEGLRSELLIKAKNSTFHPELYDAANAFEPGIGKFWRSVEPRGRHDLELTLWREFGTDEFSFAFHLGVREASIVLAQLPMPVEKVRGDLFVHGTGDKVRCDISPIRGEISNGTGAPPASVLVQGSVLDLTGKPQAEITSIVQRLRLTPELGAALGKGGILDPAVWNNLKLNGYTDVTARHRQLAGQAELQGHYRLRLRDVRSAAAILPGKQAHDLHGEIIVENGTARFDKIEGRIDETPVAILGGRAFREGEDTIFRCIASAASFPIDDRLANTMTPAVRQAFLDRRMSGRARLNQLQVTFRFKGDGSPFESEFRGDIEARDLFLDVGLPGGHALQKLNGTITITKGSGRGLTGRLKNARFELTGQQIDRIHSEFELDQQRLVMRDLTFQIAGGRVRGGSTSDRRSLAYEFTGDGRIYAFLTYENLRLQDLLRSSALARSKVRGTCNGKIVIEHLEGLDFLTMRARGDVAVREGKLGTVPLFSGIYNHIKEESRPQFTRGSVDFQIGDEQIRFDNLSVHSSLIKIEGGGTLGMDGYMDIDLGVPRVFGSAADILILPRVLNEVVKQIAQFKVFGYLRNPQIEPISPFGSSFERQSLAPIPPIRVVSPPRRSRTPGAPVNGR